MRYHQLPNAESFGGVLWYGSVVEVLLNNPSKNIFF